MQCLNHGLASQQAQIPSPPYRLRPPVHPRFFPVFHKVSANGLGTRTRASRIITPVHHKWQGLMSYAVGKEPQ
jgi:hypothetical protein